MKRLKHATSAFTLWLCICKDVGQSMRNISTSFSSSSIIIYIFPLILDKVYTLICCYEKSIKSGVVHSTVSSKFFVPNIDVWLVLKLKVISLAWYSSAGGEKVEWFHNSKWWHRKRLVSQYFLFTWQFHVSTFMCPPKNERPRVQILTDYENSQQTLFITLIP